MKFEDKKQEIQNKIKSLVKEDFILIEGFVNFPLYSELTNNTIIGGPVIPCCVILLSSTKELRYFPIYALFPGWEKL